MADCSISIVIPAYNVEKYLGEALDSLQAQDHFPDEVILIDDGSTDSTLEIAKSYRFSFPYKVLSTTNNGQGSARNLGLSLASSEYIYFFDSDDLLSKDFISSLKEHIRCNAFPDVVLFSGQSFYGKDFKATGGTEYIRGFSGVFESHIEFLNKGFLHRGLSCSPCLYISKKSLWVEKHLKFGRNYFEDEAIFFPFIFSCQSFSVLNKIFFYRRIRDGSTMTMKPSLKHVEGALDCMERTVELYFSNRLTRREKWHVRKRLVAHCSLYLRMAREAGSTFSYKKIFKTVFVTRSATLAVKVLMYFVRAEDSEVIRKVFRTVEKIGLGLRG